MKSNDHTLFNSHHTTVQGGEKRIEYVFCTYLHLLALSVQLRLLEASAGSLASGFGKQRHRELIKYYFWVAYLEQQSLVAPPPLPAEKYVGPRSRSYSFKFLRVVRDVDKAENGCAVAFIIVQSYAEDFETDILEQG